MTTPAGKEPTGGRRKVSPVLLVVLGVLIVALAVRLATLGGDEEGGDTTATPTPTTRAQDPGAVPTPAPTASPSPSVSPTAPPQTFEVFEAKDPFRPLVVATAPAPPPGPGGTPAPTATPTAGPGAGGAPAPGGGQVVELVDVITVDGTTKAQVRVGSTVYTVAPGETFASTFKVVAVSGTCATMLNGDDKFTLCRGEQVVK